MLSTEFFVDTLKKKCLLNYMFSTFEIIADSCRDKVLDDDVGTCYVFVCLF